MMDLFEDPQTDVIGELTSMHDILDNKGVLVRNRGGGGSGGDNNNSSIENIINNNKRYRRNYYMYCILKINI